MYSFSNGWYILYTRPNSERKVSSQLGLDRILNFAPMVKTISQWRDRRKIIERPLFPSYVFIYLRNQHDYFKGLSAEGVWRYVKTGKQLSKIPDSVMDSITISVAQGKGLEVSTEFFDKGESIIITSGPLTGLSGEVVDYVRKQKILIRLNLIQSNILVDLPAEHVAHASGVFANLETQRN